MDAYKLRIDTINHDVCHHICNRYSPSCWVWSVEEVASSNPHSHFYLEMDKKAQIALRAYIRQTIGSGNGCYSLKILQELKPLEYLAYVIKAGESDHHNIDLSEALAYDEKVKNSLKEKKTKPKAIDLIIIYNKWDTEPPGCIHHCIDGVVDYYKTSGILIREFSLVSQAQTLCLKYFPEEYGTYLSHNIYRAVVKL